MLLSPKRFGEVESIFSVRWKQHGNNFVFLDSLQVECKAVMVFFHYCVMSNYFWLFIEGLYLFTLLVETFFPERRYFYWYTIIGWGMWHFLSKMHLSVQNNSMSHLIFPHVVSKYTFSLCTEGPLQTKPFCAFFVWIQLNWNLEDTTSLPDVLHLDGLHLREM